jgi:hypothetical protein
LTSSDMDAGPRDDSWCSAPSCDFSEANVVQGI